VQPAQIIFTSGGTEANNLFVKGAAAYLKPAQIAISAIEHSCVARPAQELTRQGWSLRRVAVDRRGRFDTAGLDEALKVPTGLVSVMLANNETGVIQDVAAAAERARRAGALMHTDAVQAVGKIPVDFSALRVHALTLSAHKFYGPKGAGALVVDKRIELRPQMAGGGHERGLRSGTENVPAIVGFGAAAELAASRLATLAPRLEALRQRLEQGLIAAGAVIFGEGAPRLPNTTFFSLRGIDGEALLIELDKVGYAVASGAACSSANPEPSATLLAMGVEREIGLGAVRFSTGKSTTPDQIDDFLRALATVAQRLRKLKAMTV
jgi:cysteine desulfurase